MVRRVFVAQQICGHLRTSSSRRRSLLLACAVAPSRCSNFVCLAQTIIRENAVLHGDLGKINIGKLSVIGSSVVLQPPTAPSNRCVSGCVRAAIPRPLAWLHCFHTCSKLPFLHMNIGDYVMIGDGSVIRACDIRSCIRIGSNCVVVRGLRCTHHGNAAADRVPVTA